MSADFPPEYYFTNINFNSAFYEPSSTGFTQEEANLLYLRKTVADTATAIETFSAGVLTDTLNPITAGSNLTIGSSITAEDVFLGQNITSGDIYIGVNATATTGRSGTIHIGDGNNIASGTIHINNGTTNASNTNINNGATTTGTVNIMTGLTSTGTINLATGTGSAKVNIGNGTTTGAINIGNSANNVSLSAITLSLGTTSTTIVNVGNNTNTVNLAANSLTLGSVNKSLTVNTPIKVGYLPAELISNTQIGFKINETFTAPSPVPFSTTYAASNLANVVLLAGIWLLQANVIFFTPGTFLQISISGAASLIDLDAATVVAGFPNSIAQVSRIVNVGSGTPTWYFTGSAQINSNVANVRFNAYRIA
jgi:hypothetical protein